MTAAAADQKIRVMLVDDSAIIRGLMQRALKADPEIDIVATAHDGQAALTTLARTPTDIIILDVEMPVMDGLTALPQLLKTSPGTKVIMASTLTLRNAEISMRAMELGATDYVGKPSATNPNEVQDFYRSLIEKIKALAPGRSVGPAPVSRPSVAPVSTLAPVARATPASPAPASPAPAMVGRPLAAAAGLAPVIPAKTAQEALMQAPRASALAIASSTGGPQALLNIFGALKGKSFAGPVFITQHMPPNFTTILAEHITKTYGNDCHEAKDGEPVRNGVIYLAPGNYHMTVHRQGTELVLKLDQNPPENFCRPSADPMFRSLAAIYGNKLAAVVLTGMGGDGAPGAAEIVRQGGSVAAQDEASCVVYGMPRAVVDAKLVKAILPLDQMAPYISKAIGA